MLMAVSHALCYALLCSAILSYPQLLHLMYMSGETVAVASVRELGKLMRKTCPTSLRYQLHILQRCLGAGTAWKSSNVFDCMAAPPKPRPQLHQVPPPLPEAYCSTRRWPQIARLVPLGTLWFVQAPMLRWQRSRTPKHLQPGCRSRLCLQVLHSRRHRQLSANTFCSTLVISSTLVCSLCSQGRIIGRMLCSHHCSKQRRITAWGIAPPR